MVTLQERERENTARAARGLPPRWQTDTTHGAPCDVCPGCPDAGQDVWIYCPALVHGSLVFVRLPYLGGYR